LGFPFNYLSVIFGAAYLSHSRIPEAKGMFVWEILEVLGLDPLEPPLWLEKKKSIMALDNPTWPTCMQ